MYIQMKFAMYMDIDEDYRLGGVINDGKTIFVCDADRQSG